MNATLELPNDIIATIEADLAMPWTIFPLKIAKIWVEVKCEGGDVELINFVLPTFWHTIKVSTKAGGTTSTRVEKVYKFADAHLDDGNSKALALGEDWWLTYRYQLEAFVDKLKGRTPQTWVEREDSIANLEWIEKIYEKVCVKLWKILLHDADYFLRQELDRVQSQTMCYRLNDMVQITL